MLIKTAALLSAASLIFALEIQAQPVLPAPNAAPQPFIPPPPPESATKALTEFVESINKSDWLAASGRVSGGKNEAELKPVIEDLKATYGNWRLSLREMHISEEEEGFEVVKIRLRLQDKFGNKISHEERLNLQFDGKLWKIVPLAPETARYAFHGNLDSDILENLATCLQNPGLANEYKARTCMNNLKQLGLAAAMFMQDWDEKFQLKANTFADYLRPYFRDKDILVCPAHPDEAIGYSFNAKLQNVTADQIQDPAKTVLFYEGQNEKLNFRHGTRTAVAFADGHVSLVSAEDAENLRWNP